MTVINNPGITVRARSPMDLFLGMVRMQVGDERATDEEGF